MLFSNRKGVASSSEDRASVKRSRVIRDEWVMWKRVYVWDDRKGSCGTIDWYRCSEREDRFADRVTATARKIPSDGTVAETSSVVYISL